MQRVVMVATIAAVVLQLVVSALDHRFGWSSVPGSVMIGGAVLVGVGLLVAQFVVVQNGYAAATIGRSRPAPGLHRPLRRGPAPDVPRCPVMMVGTAPALDSYWGLLLLLPGVVALSARITDEEKMLTAELAGYVEYTRRVRYRVMPGVW